MKRFIIALATAGAAALASLPAAAHVVLGTDTATAGTYHRVELRVGHGCDGSPTTSVTVFVPGGVLVARPQPKAGWSLQTTKTTLEQPGKVHGKPVTEAVSQVTWSGGSLPDEQFDDFSLLVLLPEAPGALAFRVLQRCEAGQADWAEPPAAGGTRSRFPAPVLDVQAPAGAHGHGH
jgi:uncharacterized protein YcnI